MPFWCEMALKACALLAALFVGLVSAGLFLLGTLGNGGATTVEPFSWTAQIVLTLVFGTTTVTAVFGCRYAWRLVEKLSDRLIAQR